MRSNDRPRIKATQTPEMQRAGYFMGLAVVVVLTLIVIGLLLLAGAWAALWIISHF